MTNPLHREAARERALDAALESLDRPAPVDQILARRDARPEATRRSPLWIAAALLLGVGVAVGVALSRAEPSADVERPAGPQDPRPAPAQPDTGEPRQDPESAPPVVWHVANTLENLDSLPVDLRALRCRAGAREFAALRRLENLEHLAIDANPLSLLAVIAAHRNGAADEPLDFRRLGELSTLRSLEISTPDLGAEAVKAWADLPALESLTLSITRPAEGEEHPFPLQVARALRELPALSHFGLHSCQLPVESARAIAALPIESLSLELIYELTEEHLLALSALPELRSLELRSIRGKQAELFHMLKKRPYEASLTPRALAAFKGLRRLDMLHNELPTEFCSVLPEDLEALFIHGCTLASGSFDANFDLARLPKLTALGLTIAAERGSDRAFSLERGLEILADRPWRELRLALPQGLAAIAPHLRAQPHLEQLELQLDLTPESDLSFLTALPALRELHLVAGTEKLADDDIATLFAPLQHCPSLRVLTLPQGTQPEILAAVRETLPEPVHFTTRLR